MPVVLQMMPGLYLQYYVICFGAHVEESGIKFLIGDPHKGLYYCSAVELCQWWVTREGILTSPGRRSSSITAPRSKGLFSHILKPVMPALSLALFGGMLISFFTLSKIILYQEITRHSNKVVDNFLADTILLTGACIVLCSLLVAIIRHGAFKHQYTHQFSNSLFLAQSSSLLRLFNSSVNTANPDIDASAGSRVAMVQLFAFGIITEIAIVIGLFFLLINSPLQLPLKGMLIVSVLLLAVVAYKLVGNLFRRPDHDSSAKATVLYRLLLSAPVIVFLDVLFVLSVCMLSPRVFDFMGIHPAQLFALFNIAISLLTSAENIIVIACQLKEVHYSLKRPSYSANVFPVGSLML